MSTWSNSTVPDSFTVTLTHSGSFWKNFTAASVYQHMPHQKDYSFFHKLICFVFRFPPCSEAVNHLSGSKTTNQPKKPNKQKKTPTSQHQPIFAFWSLSFLCTQQSFGVFFCFFFFFLSWGKETTFSKNGKENTANKFTGLYRVGFY